MTQSVAGLTPSVTLVFGPGEQAGHIIPQNGWAWADPELHQIIANVTNAGLIHDPRNGFVAGAGHMGTHTAEYVRELIEIMRDRRTEVEIEIGLDMLRAMIEAGKFIPRRQ